MFDSDYLAPLFGLSLNPAVSDIQRNFAMANLADDAGLDFLCIQDHPYNADFLDTWTLLSVLAGKTVQVRLLPDVLNLPLRPPAMLAKSAASLDLLTQGRVELGLGAGAFWEGIVAYGGPQRTPAEALDALEEAIQVMHAIWEQPKPGQVVNFTGHYYSIYHVQPGPAPYHPIGIWLGANRPRMLQLTGRLADGWIVSAGYVPPENIPALQKIIDESALSAGRSTTAIRRAYNLAGSITQPGSPKMMPRRKGIIVGTAREWVEALARFYRELRMDTFIFWPLGDQVAQARLFAEEIVPAFKETVSKQGRANIPA